MGATFEQPALFFSKYPWAGRCVGKCLKSQIIEYCQVKMRGCVWENDDILESLFFQKGFWLHTSFIICATNSEGEASVKYDLFMRGGDRGRGSGYHCELG